LGPAAGDNWIRWQQPPAVLFDTGNARRSMRWWICDSCWPARIGARERSAQWCHKRLTISNAKMQSAARPRWAWLPANFLLALQLHHSILLNSNSLRRFSGGRARSTPHASTPAFARRLPGHHDSYVHSRLLLGTRLAFQPKDRVCGSGALLRCNLKSFEGARRATSKR